MKDIHWHDSVIERVIETPSKSELIIEVEYPIDWEKNVFEPRSIVFTDPLDYHIDEGPFHGNPTILNATIEESASGYHKIIMQTNAGKRSLRFHKVEIRNR